MKKREFNIPHSFLSPFNSSESKSLPFPSCFSEQDAESSLFLFALFFSILLISFDFFLAER